ncbi:arrestin domain-containing protein 3-like [Chanos chanos]|uniref:Arrestin domain-containing protein 3-like n=1 Tax=Chanos chanos TaxID=29144 RepID=A0A6J2UKN5_CHACN|nr:arrestin domain-containing protein 3-like [Chanos chanos]
MSGTVKDFSLRYDPINEANTFSSGDYIRGRVILEVTKEIKVKTLVVKIKGEADVHWTESRDDHDDSYSAKERYFKSKQYFIHDGSKKGKGNGGAVSGETYSNVVSPGSHVYEFCFQLPQGPMPSSFKGLHGKILYTLEAKMSRSLKPPKKLSSEFSFVSPAYGNAVELMRPLFGETDKKMKLFTSGNVSMKVNTEKKAFVQGELLKVIAAIENSSSRALKLKYKLLQTQKFIASGSTNSSHEVILKEVGDPVPSGQNQTITRQLQLPADLQPSIWYCNIIKVEHTLKVYLDVPYASDPEVIFPLVILPRGQHFGLLSTPSGGLFGNPAQPGWNGPPTHNAAGPYPSASASGVYPPPTAPGPNQHQYPPAVHPQSANPGAPPPMYSELYPNPNPNVSGSLTVPTASDCNPPPYTATAHPVPSAPGYCPDATTPEPCPSKTPL